MLKVQSYLNNQSLGNLFAKAKIMAQANKALKASLPPALKAHCQLANFSIGQATIATSSASYLTQLKTLQPIICQALRQQPQLKEVTTLRFIVVPHLCQTTPKPKFRPQLSQATKKLVSLTAQHIQHPELKQALMRLSQQDEQPS
jgi:hypothetical protein